MAFDESGTDVTMSAGAGDSAASSAPSFSRTAFDETPKAYESGREKYTCSKLQRRVNGESANRKDECPDDPIEMTRPGPTGSDGFTPSRSNAHVSEANRYPSPKRADTSGRKPSGSTAANRPSVVSVRMDHAPSTLPNASTSRVATSGPAVLANRWRNSSVSLPDWKMAPCSSS